MDLFFAFARIYFLGVGFVCFTSNFGFYKNQQIIALFSGIALVAYYSYLKEIFNRQKGNRGQ